VSENIQDKPQFATTEEAARYLGCSTFSIRRWIAMGRIPAVRPNGSRGRLAIPRSWLDEQLARCQTGFSNEDKEGGVKQ